MNLYHRSLAQIVAIAAMFGRRARIESLAPRTLKARGYGKGNHTQENARRVLHKDVFGDSHGAATWKGSFEATFGNRR